MEKQFKYTLPDNRRPFTIMAFSPLLLFMVFYGLVHYTGMKVHPYLFPGAALWIITGCVVFYTLIRNQTRVIDGLHIRGEELIYTTEHKGKRTKNIIRIPEITNLEIGENSCFSITFPGGTTLFYESAFADPAAYKEFLYTIRQIRFKPKEAAE